MSGIVRYLTHPQVRIDPDKPVPKWSLNTKGKARVRALARSGVLAGTTRIICSPETKATETAVPLAKALGVTVDVRAATHENDRSATGFLEPDAFEAAADAFFANPDDSFQGWETARDARKRIVAAIAEALAEETMGDVLIVGHGGVGTLLYCALAGAPIHRRYDQGTGGGGNYFTFGRHDLKPQHRWRPMEEIGAERR